MVDISNIFSCRTFFRCVPCGDRHIYFAGLDRISIILPSPLFLMIPSYTNKEHAREVGKKGFTGEHERDNGPAFETEFLSLSPSPCPRPTRASLRAAAMLWLLVP
jgi:hypothetical protein